MLSDILHLTKNRSKKSMLLISERFNVLKAITIQKNHKKIPPKFEQATIGFLYIRNAKITSSIVYGCFLSEHSTRAAEKKTRTHSQNPSLNSSSKSLLHWYYNPWYYNLKMNVLYLYVYFSEFNLYSLSGTTANVHAVFVCLIQRFLPSWSNV